MFGELPKLYYLSENNSKKPLPEWAYFFMALGQKLVTWPKKTKLVIGLALPTRLFACGLIAMGITYTKAHNISSSDQIDYILKLKPGTAIYIRDHNKKNRGIIEGFKERDGIMNVIIRTAQSLTTWYRLDKYASKITIDTNNNTTLPPNKPIGYQLASPSNFLKSLLGDTLAKEYVLSTFFDALIIGNVTSIENEICNVNFLSNSLEKGKLQEIIRVRQFTGMNKSYRTQCLSHLNNNLENDLDDQYPPIVLFDGAISYIKHGHKWKLAHQVVLLDKTERQFAEGINLINQNYAHRTLNNLEFSIEVPKEIEMMIYGGNVNDRSI